MKIFQSKFFVILLAVFAVGLVGKNLFWPLIKRSLPAKAITKAAHEPATPVLVAAPSTSKVDALPPALTSAESKTDSASSPAIAMNVQEAAADAAEWNYPKRDPFRVLGARSDGKSAPDLLTLKGVLRQTRSTLAVLNNQVLSVGDSILGFKVESVEDDRVWVSGPNGREVVDFKHTANPAAPRPRASAPPNLSLAPR